MSSQTITGAQRRALAPKAALLGAIAFIAFIALTATGHPYGWPGIASLVVLFAAWIGCRFLIGDIAERRADEVDEYELEQRQSARNVGYLLALGSLAALYVLATIAHRLDEHGRPALLEQLPPLVFAALLLAAASPSFLLAWRTRRRSPDLDDADR